MILLKHNFVVLFTYIFLQILPGNVKTVIILSDFYLLGEKHIRYFLLLSSNFIVLEPLEHY